MTTQDAALGGLIGEERYSERQNWSRSMDRPTAYESVGMIAAQSTQELVFCEKLRAHVSSLCKKCRAKHSALLKASTVFVFVFRHVHEDEDTDRPIPTIRQSCLRHAVQCCCIIDHCYPHRAAQYNICEGERSKERRETASHVEVVQQTWRRSILTVQRDN